MAALPKTIYSPEEYLTLEEKAPYKSEYYRGEIYAMAGTSLNHNRIALNSALELRQRLKGRPCQVFAMDVRLHVKRNTLFTYPDVMVVCGKIEYLPGQTATVTNPLVIIEVLSESTERYDRSTKFALYRDLPSLRDYVLIDQSRVFVEYFHRADNGEWIYQAFNSIEGTLYLRALDVAIPIAELYAQVEWEERESDANLEP